MTDRASVTMAIAFASFVFLTAACEKDCSSVVRDGVVNGTEQCDDENDVDGDGCTSGCVVECTVDDDCLSDTVAILKGTTCVDGRCTKTQCGTDADCTVHVGTLCSKDKDDGTTLVCNAACNQNADCGGGFHCKAKTCESGCGDDTNCNLSEVCRDNACETGCRSDDACRTYGSDDLVCRKAMGLDTGQCSLGCRVDGDCPAGTGCSMDFECELLQSCANNGDCAPTFWGFGSVCDGGDCTPGCTDNADCGPETICQTGGCTAGCGNDDDCSPGRICESNLCQNGCRDDDDCAFEAPCLGSNVCGEPVLPSPEPALCGADMGSRCAFATVAVGGGNLGGLAGADALCQARADGSPVPGLAGRTWQAWLADSTEGPATRWLELSTVPYVALDGTQVAASYADLSNFPARRTPSFDIRVRENGLEGDLLFMWTGTFDGLASYGAASDFNCNGWTSSDNADGAMYGFNDQAPFGGWTVIGGAGFGGTPIPGGPPNLTSFEELACDFDFGGAGLYCFEMVATTTLP